MATSASALVRAGYRTGMNVSPTMRTVLLVAALVLFLLVGLAGAGWLIDGHKDPVIALEGFGLACFTASHL